MRAAEAPPSGDARGERAKPGADILRACHTDLRPCHADPLSLSRGSLNTKRGSPAPATRILRPCRADLRPCHADLPSLPRGFSILGWSWARLGEVLGRSWEVLVKSWGTVRQALSLRALNALNRCRNRRGTALGWCCPKTWKFRCSNLPDFDEIIVERRCAAIRFTRSSAARGLALARVILLLVYFFK